MSLAIELHIPRSILVVIDDGGMLDRIGEVGPGRRFPTIVNRPLGAADYETLARIGHATGTRLQVAMILCYWDCDGVCAKVPSTTWLGAAWKPQADRAWMESCAQVFIDHPEAIEFAMHGVGHDYFIDGVPHIGEWCDRVSGEPWPIADLQRHMDCFMEIVAQTGIPGRVPYRVPESFVPCYFQCLFEEGNPLSTGHLVAANGMRYVSTPYGSGLHTPSDPMPPRDGFFDSGLLVLERDHTDVRWNDEATVPPRLPCTSICGMHWGNFLSTDPAGNAAVAERWIAYLHGIDTAPGLMLAPTAEHCWSQWVAHTYARTRRDGEGVTVVDLSNVPERAWSRHYLQAFTLTATLPAGQRLVGIDSAAFDLVGIREVHGQTRLTVQPRGRHGGTLRPILSTTPAP